jgi:chromosomal replication initiation ATPase DnaA
MAGLSETTTATETPIAESVAKIVAPWERLLEQSGIAPGQKLERVRPEEGDDGPPPPLPVEGKPPVAQLPARFRDVRFASYETETPSQRLAMTRTREWVERVIAGKGPMLALIGKQGTGKSHLAYAALHALHESGVRPLYARPWYRLSDELRYGGRDPFTDSLLEAKDVRDVLWCQRVVLIDELRATANTPFDETEIAKFTCHAYDQRIAVLVTTNAEPLRDLMGDAAASRFTQTVIVGRDRRQA